MSAHALFNVIKQRFCYGLLLGLLLSSQGIHGDTLDFSILDAGDNQIQVEVMPAQGDLLIIWLVDHEEVRPQFEHMLQTINASGIEIWRIDLLADYFLTRNSQNIRSLPGEAVAALIDKARQTSNKQLLLAAYDRMSLPLLRGVHQWQMQYRQTPPLLGAILFYPNLYGPSPVAGEDPQFDPIVAATNIPIVVYQPALGTHRWRLSELMDTFWSGKSQAVAYLAPNIRDWFFMHTPGENSAEDLATNAVAADLHRFTSLLKHLSRPTHAVELKPSFLGKPIKPELHKFRTEKVAPAFSLKNHKGQTIQLDDYLGKVTLVNFWATWCPPCVEEIPSLNQLAAHYSADLFNIVSIDFREPAELINSFTEKIPVNFPILTDSDGKVATAWKVFSFPSSFIIDKKGYIRFSVNQAIEWNTNEIWQRIDQLVAEDNETD